MDMKCKTHHKDDGSTFYTACRCNCGGSYQCIIKANVKDGKVISVEPDDRYNYNCGREDAYMEEEDLQKVRIQRRPCVIGLTWHKFAQLPGRILYPLKRKEGTERGAGEYERITWDEALDTLAAKMIESREKYGPLSIITPYMPNETYERIMSYWGAGAEGWGWCSYDAARLMAQMMTGGEGWEVPNWSSSSGADMLTHSKAIVLWGCDPTVGHQGPAHAFAWYIKLARERGKPVIIIDARYSMAVRSLADQWIPIKPGTDVAMMMGMAYTLFEADTYDKAFIEKYVEPVGFQKFKDYCLGKAEDQTPKTPEWAAEKCGVPAETIRALAHFVWDNDPCWTYAHWSLSRKSQGEQVIVTFAALQAMLGNWGKPGGGPAIHPGGQVQDLPMGFFSTAYSSPGPYKVPKLFRSHYWAQAVLLLDDYKSGKISAEEYMSSVGWRADKNLVDQFNPRFLFWGGGSKPHASNHLVTACDTAGDQIKAMNKMDFIVTAHSNMTPTVRYADIILPVQDWIWEGRDVSRTAPYGVFEAVQGNPGVVEPPGETRQWVWIYVEICKRLGVDPKDFYRYYTGKRSWEEDWENGLREMYHGIEEYYQGRGKTIPTYDNFQNGEFLNCDELEDQPMTGFVPQMKENKPFKTPSGKIEFYYPLFEDESRRGKSEHYTFDGRLIDNLPADWKDMPSSPEYKIGRNGMDDPKAKEYPIMMLTSHSRYRVHYVHWTNPWLRGHVYRHRVWINAVDAAKRGIKDNDMILVYNDRGKIIMPAYVTSRIMPGTALIHQGGNYEPDENGIDRGASPNTLLGGDKASNFTPARSTNLVQIEKYEEAHV